MDLSGTACLLLAAMLFDAVIGDPPLALPDRSASHGGHGTGAVILRWSFQSVLVRRHGPPRRGRGLDGGHRGILGALGALISVGLSHWQSGFWVEALLVSC